MRDAGSGTADGDVTDASQGKIIIMMRVRTSKGSDPSLCLTINNRGRRLARDPAWSSSVCGGSVRGARAGWARNGKHS